MDEIRDLIKIVSDNTKRNIPLLDLKNQHKNGNKEMNLFLGIKNGEFQTDEDASNGIYGSEEVDFKFRMLKSRLNRKLLNHLFFMDFSANEYTKSRNLYQEALDYLHFSRMLLNIGETKIGAKLLHKTMDLAKECEFTVIVIDCLRELRNIYAQTYRPKLFRNIKGMIQENEKIERSEEIADAIYQENRLYINSTVNNRKKNFDSYLESVAELEKLYTKTNSYNIFEKHMKLQMWYYELTGDFENVLKFTESIEKKFDHGKINERRYDSLFIYRSKGNALIKLKKIDEGKAFLQQMLDKVDNTSSDWFMFAEKYVRLNIHCEHFEKASEVFLRVVSNKSFADLNEEDTLRWNIVRSYLYLLTGNKKLIKKFDVQKFFEETPEFSKERAGYNTAVLIMQVISKIENELEVLHDKLDAIDDYVNRYLNNSFSKRTKTFCKLLHKTVIHNRDYEVIVAKSRYLQEKLFDSETAGKSFVDYEVVSYEFLWNYTLDKIRKFK